VRRSWGAFNEICFCRTGLAISATELEYFSVCRERYLQRHSRERQPLSWEQRQELIPRFELDIKLLENVLGESFRDWIMPRERSGGMVGARPAGQGQARNGRP